MCTTCSECVTDVYVGVKHTCVTYTPSHALVPINTYSKVHVTLTAGHAHTRPCIYACTCMHMHMGAYARPRHRLTHRGAATRTLHLCIRVHMHAHANACACTHTRAHAHMNVHAHMHACAYVCIHVYTHAHRDVRMHARTNTPGTTAPQRQGEELMQTPEASHISPVRRNQPHLASPILGLHCTHFLRPQYPSTPPPLFPIYPRTVHGPRQAWFCCPTLIVVQSAHHALPHSAPSKLWRTSVQLYNGPLHSCRKIRGKTAVQQSLSRRARTSPSPTCRMWLPRATRGQ